MKYTLTKGSQSNFEINITLSEAEMSALSDKTLKNFQKDVDAPGFRKGFVPLAMVKDLIRPGYLEMGMLEELVHSTITKVLDEHKDKQFIGQPYDFNPMQLKNSDKGVYTITFKLDVYPDPVEKDKKWLKLPMKKLSITISDDKKNSVIATIKKQYAEYEDTDKVALDTVSKIKVTYKDKAGQVISSRPIYVGDEEFTKDPLASKVFVGMNKTDILEQKYDVKSLPSFTHFTGEGAPVTISFELQDCKKIITPEFTDAFIKEKFGDSGMLTEKDLLAQIEQTLHQTQAQEELQKQVDEYLDATATSFDIMIPETFLQEEVKHRLKHLEGQLGGESGLKKFMENMGEEKAKAYVNDITKSAQTSLGKFLLLKKIVEEQGLEDINWNIQLDAEKKLYKKLTGDDFFAEDQEKQTAQSVKKKVATKKAKKDDTK